MNSDVIIVRNLTKRFGAFTAVDAISFSVRRGEIFGFLGANGAGKTTAMRMLCGLSIPTAGSASVAGCDIVTEPEPVKRNIGYMSQRFALYGALTVMQNLRLFATVYGMSDADFRQSARTLMQWLDMESLADTTVSSLPVGWKQKLAFAAATIHNPSVLFLDEPTGGVDPITRRRFWELIYKVASEGMTVFVTTHYLDEAEYCDRVCIMVDGSIRALDTPAELKKKYKCDTVDAVFRQVAQTALRSADA